MKIVLLPLLLSCVPAQYNYLKLLNILCFLYFMAALLLFFTPLEWLYHIFHTIYFILLTLLTLQKSAQVPHPPQSQSYPNPHTSWVKCTWSTLSIALSLSQSEYFLFYWYALLDDEFLESYILPVPQVKHDSKKKISIYLPVEQVGNPYGKCHVLS